MPRAYVCCVRVCACVCVFCVYACVYVRACACVCVQKGLPKEMIAAIRCCQPGRSIEDLILKEKSCRAPKKHVISFWATSMVGVSCLTSKIILLQFGLLLASWFVLPRSGDVAMPYGKATLWMPRFT